MVVRYLIAILLTLFASAQPAAAATTVFGASVYSTSGNVSGAANALGTANGSTATIVRVPGGSSLVLAMGLPITGAGTVITGARLTPTTNVQIAVGTIVGSVAVFSANFALPAAGPNFAMDLTAACKTVSATGCSLLRVSVNGAPGSGFSLDGILGVTPEPSTWVLMILGFAGVAWRLKQKRRFVPAFA